MTKDDETALVRELARRVAEIANTAAMSAKRQRWRDAYMLPATPAGGGRKFRPVRGQSSAA